MITVIINATVKEDRLAEFKEMVSLLTREARSRSGCITYKFNQSIKTPTEFVLYEQWESQSDLDRHIQALTALLGSPKPGGVLPEKLLSLYEKAEATYYNALE